MEPDELPTKRELAQLSKTKRKIGIVIPVLHYFEGACELLASVKTRHDYTVIVMPQWRAQVPLSKAWNDGAQQAFDMGCDYALVCNDDIMFAPQCIDNMVAEYERLRPTEKVIMVTPNNIFAQLPNKYDILSYQTPDDPYTWAEHPNFSCFLITPEYFEKIGKFDENFNPAWYEDNDSHRRATLAGYKEITTTAAPQVHIGGVSTSMLPHPANSEASRQHYVAKWGGIPGGEAFATPYNDPTKTVKDW